MYRNIVWVPSSVNQKIINEFWNLYTKLFNPLTLTKVIWNLEIFNIVRMKLLESSCLVRYVVLNLKWWLISENQLYGILKTGHTEWKIDIIKINENRYWK